MIRRRTADESGFALIGAILILLVLMGIGLALVSRADTQSNLSGGERVRESGFDLAEAVLNTQALQLGRSWPTVGTTNCDPTTSATSYCPNATAISNSFTTRDYSSACPTNASTKLWQTQIRDNSTPNPEYWSSTVTSQPTYDANGDGVVWVRAWGTLQCKPISIVGQVSNTSVPIQVAGNAITANWFATTNQGKKVIVDTLGSYAQPPSARPGPASQPAAIALRCSAGAPSTCANYSSSKGQIQPPTVQTSSTTSSAMLTANQLSTLEQQAAAAGSYWSSSCPTTAAQLTSPTSGAPVVVKGPCNISITGTTDINSSTAPGALIVENGTITLGGTVTFYGLLYMVNNQGSSGSVVNIGGNAAVQGSVSVDGAGGVTAGSSKTNLIFDSRALGILKGSTGAALNRGTVRVLPPSTP